MLTYEYREIPSITGEVGGDEIYLGTPTGDSGKKLPRTFPSDGSVDAGDSYPAEEIYVDPDGGKYAFVTWNVTCADGAFAAFVIDDLQLTFTSGTAANTTATAWYVRIGGGDGPPSVTCYGLDRIANRFFRRTPIDSAAPPSAWAGGQSRDLATSESAVAASAVSQIAGEVLIDKLQIYLAIHAEFTQWRLRKHKHAPGDPLALAHRDTGVAVAVYEQTVVGGPIATIPREIFEMLHGGKLDIERLRRHPIDGPDWGAFDPERLIRDVAQLDHDLLGRLHSDLTEIAKRSRTMLEITERVLRG